MSDEQNCRQAFDDFYHKIKAEVSYDHWCSIWRFISKRQARGEPIELLNVTEQITKGGGFWRSCTGCHESNEGYDTGPYSKTLKCHLGVGCSECGGIGAIWDTTDYDALGDYMAQSMGVKNQQQGSEPDVVLQITHNGGEVAEPQILKTSAQFDALPNGTVVSLYTAQQPQQQAGEPVAVCVTCGGSGMVDDGEIDCYESGEPYENGPVKCVKDCPDCTPQPQQQAGGEPVARWAVSADGQNRTALPVSFTEDGYKRLNSIRDGAMLYTTPQPQQIPDGYKLVPRYLIDLCEQFTRWRNCMSYNDSYFGEPEGDLKRIAAEMERAMLEAAPEPKITSCANVEHYFTPAPGPYGNCVGCMQHCKVGFCAKRMAGEL